MKKLRMNQFRISRIIFSLITLLCVIQCNPAAKQPDDNSKVKQMIASLALEQKAQLLIGTGMFMDLPDSVREKFGGREPENTDTVYSGMVDRIRKYLPGAAGFTAEFQNLGICSQVLADGPAGLRISPQRRGEEKTFYCTAFPIATMLASSWDTALVRRVGEAMGEEVLEYGADVILGPGMNIQRDPLCGRNFEYYSEDPLITGKMAAAMVQGIQSKGVGTSVKHFAANNQETNRMSVNTLVSERALREIYLKGFEIAVKEAHPWTVMSSYNKINGTYTSESHKLLTRILRDDWDFQGYVMTDWGGGSDVVAQMKAGNDLIMPGQPQQIEELVQAVREGRLDEAVLDQNLGRVLRIMMKTPRYRGYQHNNTPDLEAHARITRQAATDGMVLLENKNQALPFSADLKKVAAFGNTSYDFISGGTGSGDVNEAYTVSLTEGLKNGGYEVNEELAGLYHNYIREMREQGGKSKNWLAALMGGKDPVAEMELSREMANKIAVQSDIALITIGRNSGEGGDRKAEPGDFYLTDTEKELIRQVSEAFHARGKKSVVILNVGGVVETASWTSWPDAVLLAWQPGQEAGNSVVDLLSGKVNPSGKLAVTFPVSYADCPSAKSFPGMAVEGGEEDQTADLSGFSFMRRVPWKSVYEEDIYVGYRHYNTFDVPVAYEFGYGLSYTGFELTNLETYSPTFDGKYGLQVDVKNTGKVAGKEVVQLYVSAPSEKLEKPESELRAFAKTRLLQPGETETLHFELGPGALVSFDPATSCWQAEAGEYELRLGFSSRNICQRAGFVLKEELILGPVSGR
ncbi:MAG: glycoside hydrolase family 3 N-terminal domain-containing protein [Mangrovibacterium sp.]